MASSPTSRCDGLQEDLVHSDIALLQTPDGVVKTEEDAMSHEIALDDDDDTAVGDINVSVVHMTDDGVGGLDDDVEIHNEADDELKATIKSEDDLDVEVIAEVDADSDGIMQPDNEAFITHGATSAPITRTLNDTSHDDRDDEQLLHNDPNNAIGSVNVNPLIKSRSQSSARDPHSDVASVDGGVSNIEVGQPSIHDHSGDDHDDVGVTASVTPLAHVHTDVDSGAHHTLHEITLTHDGSHGAHFADFLPASSSSPMPLHQDTGRESPPTPPSLNDNSHLHLSTRTQANSAEATAAIVAATAGTNSFQPHLDTQLHLENIAYPQLDMQRPRKKRRTYNSEEERRNARILKNRRTAEESRQRRLKRMQDLEENARRSKEREHTLIQQLEQTKAEFELISGTLKQTIEHKNALLAEKEREIQALRSKLSIKRQN